MEAPDPMTVARMRTLHIAILQLASNLQVTSQELGSVCVVIYEQALADLDKAGHDVAAVIREQQRELEFLAGAERGSLWDLLKQLQYDPGVLTGLPTLQ